MTSIIGNIQHEQNARTFAQNVLFPSKKPISTQSYWNIIYLLAQATHLICKNRKATGNSDPQKTIAKLWNKGTPQEAKIQLKDLANALEGSAPPNSTKDGQHGGDLRYDQNPETWYQKPLEQKSMTARKKQRQLLETLYKAAGPDSNPGDSDQFSRLGLSPDERLVVETMFVHTAVSKPADQQGRDLLERAPTYFRSGSHPAKQEMADAVKDIDDAKLQAKTVSPFNQAMFNLLREERILSGELAKTEFIEIRDHHHSGIATYLPERFSKVSGLGLISNAIRTARILSQLGEQIPEEDGDEDNGALDPDVEEDSGSEDGFDEDLSSDDSDSATPRGDRVNIPETSIDGRDDLPSPRVVQNLGHIVDPSWLSPTGYKDRETNYHDHMLQNRGTIIREVGDWVNANFTGIRAVQSPDHPSLILELTSGTEINQGKYTWMNSFIQGFNHISDRDRSKLRLTHRNSFGFLYPTASEVGGPVRIWPGAVPASVLKHLLKSTIKNLAEQNSHSPQAATDQETFADTRTTRHRELNEDSPLHLETLRSAVRFTHLTLQRSARPKANPTLYTWVLQRLERNLQKAKFLLDPNNSTEVMDWEHHFLKSAGVIENLMEYSYMFLAVTEESAPLEEPYRGHIQRNLINGHRSQSEEDGVQTPEDPPFRLFHLDSGMQALTLAGLIARKYLQEAGRLQSKATMTLAKPYFEVPGVNKFKLDFKEVQASQNPDLIFTDLNPVLTSGKDRDAYSSESLESTLKEGHNSNNTHKPIPIMDITNSNLAKVGNLMLRYPYPNYMVAESLSKHEHLGTDKFNAGRLIVVGDSKLLEIAQELAEPVEQDAGDPLVDQYRRQVDQVFYGTFTGPGHDKPHEPGMPKNKKTQFMKLTSYRRPEGQEESESEYSEHNPTLAEAFDSLKENDQNHLLNILEENQEEHPTLNERGIENLGNTCYLAAVLNALASSSYHEIFMPARHEEPESHKEPKSHRAARAEINRALDRIRGGKLIRKREIARILVILNQHKLLERSTSQGINIKPLLIQRDPAEVINFILDFFDRKKGKDFKLGQTHEVELSTYERCEDYTGKTEELSELNKDSKIIRTQRELSIHLPISDASSFDEAMEKFRQPEPIHDFTALEDGKPVRGEARFSTELGQERPKTLTIQLVRWRGDRIKEDKDIEMPPTLSLNDHYYQLVSVIYHQGQSAEEGHYTTSTLTKEGWQHRDDANVKPEIDFEERSKKGYIFIYDRKGRIERPQNLPNLNKSDTHNLFSSNEETFGKLYVENQSLAEPQHGLPQISSGRDQTSSQSLEDPRLTTEVEKENLLWIPLESSSGRLDKDSRKKRGPRIPQGREVGELAFREDEGDAYYGEDGKERRRKR